MSDKQMPMHRRFKVSGEYDGYYHCMTRTVNGERLFADREKEVLRKMIWQVADFSGVEVLTYAVMSNHFHVLVRVPAEAEVSDEELVRRYRVLYPKPTKYQTASIEVMEATLKEARSTGSEQAREKAEAIRGRLLARMGDVSQFMKTLKQRFSVWFNRTHERFGTLWAERFKSVLVEGKGNPLQTMAAYIDLNPVRAGLCKDPKDYRFCGYAEAVAQSAGLGQGKALSGLRLIWAAYADGSLRDDLDGKEALRAHRSLLFTKGSEDGGGMDPETALRELNEKDGVLPRPAALRCRARYFTDGAILGSAEFVRGFAETWQSERGRAHPPKAHRLRGADWGDLTVIQGLRRRVFG
ncbi:MAG: transposase [Opitutales bacterium]